MEGLCREQRLLRLVWSAGSRAQRADSIRFTGTRTVKFPTRLSRLTLTPRAE